MEFFPLMLWRSDRIVVRFELFRPMPTPPLLTSMGLCFQVCTTLSVLLSFSTRNKGCIQGSQSGGSAVAVNGLRKKICIAASYSRLAIAGLPCRLEMKYTSEDKDRERALYGSNVALLPLTLFRTLASLVVRWKMKPPLSTIS